MAIDAMTALGIPSVSICRVAGASRETIAMRQVRRRSPIAPLEEEAVPAR
jgi:hypothetical protein